MPMTTLLEKAKKFEIQSYKRPKDLNEMRENHVPYTGSPRMHPHEPDTVILLVDPYGGSKFYYEFKADSISYVEELPSVSDVKGKTVPMVRIWVQKGSVGILCNPFVVADTSH